MPRYAVGSEEWQDARTELNHILKQISTELAIARGYSGDIDMEARMVHTDDSVYNNTQYGPVLKDENERYWRVWTSTTGSLYTETVDPGFRD